MRVLHLSPYIGDDPKFGGISRFVSALSTAQASMGIDVTVAAAADSDQLATGAPSGGFHTIYLPTAFRRLGDWTNIRITPILLRNLPQLVQVVDIVHIHGLRTFQSAVFSVLRKSRSPVIVIQPHGTLAALGEKRLPKILFDALVGKRLYWKAAAWIALTRREGEQLRGAGIAPKRIKVIPNGIDTAISPRSVTKSEFALRFGALNPQVPWLLYLGRMHESKGLTNLFEAFRKVKSETAGAQLLLIGPADGSVRSATFTEKTKRTNEVIWLGTLSEELKLQALSASQILVTPAFFGFPTTFIEAMTVGTPIVTCRGHGLEEEFEEVITFAASPKDLADTIKRLLGDPASLSQIAVRSREIARKTLDISLVAKQHVQLYSDLEGDL